MYNGNNRWIRFEKNNLNKTKTTRIMTPCERLKWITERREFKGDRLKKKWGVKLY